MRDEKTDRLTQLSKILTTNFSKLKQMAELLAADKIEEMVELDNKRRHELTLIEHEKTNLKACFGKRKYTKTRTLHFLGSSDQNKKYTQVMANTKERFLNQVRISLKRTVTATREIKSPKFKLLELWFCFKKLEGENLLLLIPTYEEIVSKAYKLSAEESTQFRPDDPSESFLYSGDQFSSNICFIHFDSCIVCNIRIKIQKTPDLRERLKSLDFEITIEDFNFHSLFENARNFKAANIPRKYQLDYNSKKTSEKFEGLLITAKKISLQLSASDFEFYNQLTKGFKVKSEEFSVLKDNKVYMLKFVESMKEFMEISIQKSNLFCGYCHKHLIVSQNANVKHSYPTYYSKKKFHHLECFEQLANF